MLLEVNWGTSSQAMNLQDALTSIQQLVHIEEHVKNYQPQILALTGPPRSRPALVDFAYLICKKNSMLVCGNVVQVKNHIQFQSSSWNLNVIGWT
jgi:solute carrier family 12 sodium/potassium/chloride transporter 2